MSNKIEIVGMGQLIKEISGVRNSLEHIEKLLKGPIEPYEMRRFIGIIPHEEGLGKRKNEVKKDDFIEQNVYENDQITYKKCEKM